MLQLALATCAWPGGLELAVQGGSLSPTSGVDFSVPRGSVALEPPWEHDGDSTSLTSYVSHAMGGGGRWAPDPQKPRGSSTFRQWALAPGKESRVRWRRAPKRAKNNIPLKGFRVHGWLDGWDMRYFVHVIHGPYDLDNRHHQQPVPGHGLVPHPVQTCQGPLTESPIGMHGPNQQQEASACAAEIATDRLDGWNAVCACAVVIAARPEERKPDATAKTNFNLFCNL